MKISKNTKPKMITKACAGASEQRYDVMPGGNHNEQL